MVTDFGKNATAVGPRSRAGQHSKLIEATHGHVHGKTRQRSFQCRGSIQEPTRLSKTLFELTVQSVADRRLRELALPALYRCNFGLAWHQRARKQSI
jgi:hypothetical protein